MVLSLFWICGIPYVLIEFHRYTIYAALSENDLSDSMRLYISTFKRCNCGKRHRGNSLAVSGKGIVGSCSVQNAQECSHVLFNEKVSCWFYLIAIFVFILCWDHLYFGLQKLTSDINLNVFKTTSMLLSVIRMSVFSATIETLYLMQHFDCALPIDCTDFVILTEKTENLPSPGPGPCSPSLHVDLEGQFHGWRGIEGKVCSRVWWDSFRFKQVWPNDFLASIMIKGQAIIPWDMPESVIMGSDGGFQDWSHLWKRGNVAAKETLSEGDFAKVDPVSRRWLTDYCSRVSR